MRLDRRAQPPDPQQYNIVFTDAEFLPLIGAFIPRGFGGEFFDVDTERNNRQLHGALIVGTKTLMQIITVIIPESTYRRLNGARGADDRVRVLRRREAIILKNFARLGATDRVREAAEIIITG